MFRKGKRKDAAPKEFEERLLEIRRVTRVTTGGRRMSFRATMLLGNKKGKIGIGTAKGPDVSIAVRKASHEAYKSIIEVPVTEWRTVPYPIIVKHKACKVKLIPAAPGTGMKAGSSLRTVLELAGYENMLSKIIGANNKLNVAITTFKALSAFKHSESFAANFGKKKEEKKTEKLEKVEKTEKADKEVKNEKKVAKKPAKKATKEKTEEKK